MEILGFFVIMLATLAVVILYAALAVSSEAENYERTTWYQKEGGTDGGKEKGTQVME